MRMRVLTAAAVVAAVLVVPATARGSATQGSETLAASRVMETARGTVRTLDLPGDRYLVVHAFGGVSVANGDGSTAWSLSTQALYDDWDITWPAGSSGSETPELAWGSNPIDPLEFYDPGYGEDLANTHPFAAGEIGGREVIAVAETVGVQMGVDNSCELCAWPFDAPGSSLHLGTFVSVLDARTGQMLYHEVDPGYVTQLAIADDRLVIGDETGDPQRENGIGAWDSFSTLRALAFGPGWHATRAWDYSTGSEWGRLLDVSVTGDGAIALAWSDTPPGLGTPRPPDGHVLLFDGRDGRIVWQVRTAGYPVLTAPDDLNDELSVVQLTDPLSATGYTLTGLRYANGSTTLSVPRSGALPLSLAVGRQGWAVGSVDATVVPGYLYYTPLDGRVTLTDPRTGSDLWSVELPSSSYGVPLPIGLVLTRDRVVVGSWLGAAAEPLSEADAVSFLDSRTGAVISTSTGDPGDPLSLSAAGRDSVRAVTSHQVVVTYDADGTATTDNTAAGPGDFLTATTASVSAPSATDLIAGNEDGDVYAFDGRAIAAGNERVLWQTLLPGPVHQIVHATLDGRPVLVAAATTAVGVLDQRTGRLLRLIEVPDTYVYTVTVISAGGVPSVVVPGTSLTAYSLVSGAELWQYAAPSGAYFSDAVASSGVVAAEYSDAPTGKAATEMAAIALNPGTGAPLWSVSPSATTIKSGELWNGVAAGPDGIAFAWRGVDGDGEVDVRDPETGALVYSDTSFVLDYLTGYIDNPSLGLVAESREGAELLTASGGEASQAPAGMSAAIASTASGTEALLTADSAVFAYPMDVFTDSSASSLTEDTTYISNGIVSGDFASNGSEQVVSFPGDFAAYETVAAETDTRVGSSAETDQHGLAVLTLATSSASGSSASARHTQTETGSATPEPVRTGIASPDLTAGTVRHDADSTDPAGYSPAQIGSYLGLTGDGSGQTIAIVDAYDDPDIASDAETFSEQYGLPGVCGAGGTAGDCFTLDVEQQSASAGSDGDWALETSLDVEWAHAIAPRATIVLIETADDSFASLFSGVQTATRLSPAAVSMSWGIDEEFTDETWYDHFCAVSSTVCVVAAGDLGHPGNYPAYNPSVVSVGGTTLTLSSSGSVSSELAWADSGGGQSWVEPEPSYQDAVQSSGMRQMPDVSYEADPNTGVAVYDSVPYQGESGWWLVGGTSVGAPSWSAILAATDQLRVAEGKAPLTAAGDAAQQAIYSLPSTVLEPVTAGPDNGFCPVGCAPTTGYDEITGLGSPRSGIDEALASRP
jgi:hypothetical protein